MSTADLIKDVEDFVKEKMAAYDPSHDWAHVHRVRQTALRIADSMHGDDREPDRLVVELAALCHDLNAKYEATASLFTMLSPSFKTHAKNISPSQSIQILELIPFVSYSTERRLRAQNPSGWTPWHDENLALHCVQDADRLDAIGGIGIMRCAAFSGAMGRLLLGKEEGQETAEGHFYDKLLNVKDRLKTDWARKEAEKRQQTMLMFLKALDDEAEMLRG